jgi:hypothetical protein
MNWKLIAPIAIVALVVGGIVWFVTQQTPESERPTRFTQTAEGTDIPKAAKQLDDFTFVDESGVYIRSVMGTSTLKIPDADPETFHILSPLTEYANQEIQDFCKGPGRYGVYADRKKVYLFQAWKTPTFSKTKIEVVQGADPDSFTVEGPRSFMNEGSPMTFSYAFATTSCAYSITGS